MSGTVDLKMNMEGGVGVVVFESGCMSDVEGIAAARVQVKDFIGREKPGGLVFDFSKVRFFSSQVLGLLLDVRAGLRKVESDVVISGINPQLYRVFRITNLDKIFKFYEDCQVAVDAIGTD